MQVTAEEYATPVAMHHPDDDHARAVMVGQNASYLANRAALEFSANLRSVDAQHFTESDIMETTGTVTLIPTLSPRSESWNHSNARPHDSFPQNNLNPEVIYMCRTVAIATERPLHGDELLNAQSAEWSVPSRNFEQLTERLMVFFSAHDGKKANYHYVGNLLRRNFGEIHIGQQPESFIEQNMLRKLHGRYFETNPCVRVCAPPGCGGAYDTSAPGWLHWWLLVLLLPTIGCLIAGILFTVAIQQYSFTAKVPATSLEFQLQNISTVDGVRYDNWVAEETSSFSSSSRNRPSAVHLLSRLLLFRPTLPPSVGLII